MGSSSKTRIQYIDVARGIAIISIILGHLGSDNVSRFVYTYDLPLFFLVTGFFIDEKSSLKQFVKRKFRTLIIPYLITGAAVTIIAMLIGLFTNGDCLTPCKEWLYAVAYGSGNGWLDPIYIKAVGPIWFFLVTFVAAVLVKVLLNSSTPFRIFAIAAAFVFGYITSQYFWMPFSIQLGFCSALYVYIGYVFFKEKELLGKMSSELRLVLLTVCLAVWISFIMRFQSFWMVVCDFGNGLIDILSSVCACVVIFAISAFIEKHVSPISRILSFLGKNSIFILCAHTIEFNLFQREYVRPFLSSLDGAKLTITLAAIDLTYAIAAGIALSKIKPLRKAFGLKD